MEQMNALLAFHFKDDPIQWDDEKFARMWAYLQYSLELESKRTWQKT
jgi:hypothetical protein